MNCIVHYPVKDYSTIKPLTPTNVERIRKAKQLRESLGGENNHADQCTSIPDIVDENKHGIHLTPCYKKFTLILSKRGVSEIDENEYQEKRKSSRLEDMSTPSSSSVWLYPKECYFCRKYWVKRNKKLCKPSSVQTLDAEATIKAAAKENNLDMYSEIKDVCLIAKEFKFHFHCYRDFTRGFHHKERFSCKARYFAHNYLQV